MYKTNTDSPHVAEVTLWAWHRSELAEVEAHAVETHVAGCTICAQRAAQISALLKALQARHHAVQPTLAQQMQLLRAVQDRTKPELDESVWVKTSGRMLRWLAPAVVALTILFVVTRQDSGTVSSERFSAFLADTPEAALFSAATEEEAHSAMLELMLSSEPAQR